LYTSIGHTVLATHRYSKRAQPQPEELSPIWYTLIEDLEAWATDGPCSMMTIRCRTQGKTYQGIETKTILHALALNHPFHDICPLVRILEDTPSLKTYLKDQLEEAYAGSCRSTEGSESEEEERHLHSRSPVPHPLRARAIRPSPPSWLTDVGRLDLTDPPLTSTPRDRGQYRGNPIRLDPSQRLHEARRVSFAPNLVPISQGNHPRAKPIARR